MLCADDDTLSGAAIVRLVSAQLTELITDLTSFEKRRMGFIDLMEGYRKSDALVS